MPSSGGGQDNTGRDASSFSRWKRGEKEEEGDVSEGVDNRGRRWGSAGVGAQGEAAQPDLLWPQPVTEYPDPRTHSRAQWGGQLRCTQKHAGLTAVPLYAHCTHECLAAAAALTQLNSEQWTQNTPAGTRTASSPPLPTYTPSPPSLPPPCGCRRPVHVRTDCTRTHTEHTHLRAPLTHLHTHTHTDTDTDRGPGGQSPGRSLWNSCAQSHTHTHTHTEDCTTLRPTESWMREMERERAEGERFRERQRDGERERERDNLLTSSKIWLTHKLAVFSLRIQNRLPWSVLIQMFTKSLIFQSSGYN